jgi:transposase-like protein
MTSKTMKEHGRSARDEAERSEAPWRAAERPDPEVLAKATRRQFSAAYKLRVLEEADACEAPGSMGALLRREGLYSSHLTVWRRARREGALGALTKPRGPRGRRQDPVALECEQLRQENARLKRRLQQAETILEIQKKASEILGIPLSPFASGEPA